MSSARERVFANLHAALQRGGFNVPETGTPLPLMLNRQERIDRLKTLMENMHTEVYVVKADDWLNALKELLRQRSLNGLVYGPGTPLAEALEPSWENDLPPLIPYNEEIERFKDRLFTIDAGITSTRGGIAETGALILGRMPGSRGDLEERIGDAIGVEARSQGANFFGGVCINLLRHPAWGRAQETYGEDPYLLGEMGAALVRGVQRHYGLRQALRPATASENARIKVDVRVTSGPCARSICRTSSAASTRASRPS